MLSKGQYMEPISTAKLLDDYFGSKVVVPSLLVCQFASNNLLGQ